MNILQLFRRIRRRLQYLGCKYSTRFKIRHLYAYDRNRFSRHSGAFHQQEREQKNAAVIMAYHIVEKGLTMPERRLGFGHDVILNLISLLRSYAETEDVREPAFQHALSVLKTYQTLHRAEGFPLKPDLQRELDSLLANYPDTQEAEQLEMTREQYFADISAPFPVFAESRHSVRHLCGTVSLEQIERAVSVARSAPSACNRQHTRVHCICDKQTQREILSLQNGNRGFGNLADKLLVITADLHDIRWAEERNDLYTNAGIFLMNLCYALHANQVAHCILNWSVTPALDSWMRTLVPIPAHENIICILACGDCPERFSLAVSPRKPVRQILTIHK